LIVGLWWNIQPTIFLIKAFVTDNSWRHLMINTNRRQSMRRLLIFIPILLFTVIAQEKPIDNKADELQIKGYVIGQYTYYEADSAFANGITSPLHDAFAIRSARLVATGQLKHGFNYHIMAEFFPSGSADVQVMQAWVGYQFNQFARFRFGQFKYPFGYEAYKNNTTWSFANSSKVTGAVVKPLGAEGGKFRDIGLEVAGEYEFSGSLTGVYKLMVMNGSGPRQGGIEQWQRHCRVYWRTPAIQYFYRYFNLQREIRQCVGPERNSPGSAIPIPNQTLARPGRVYCRRIRSV
jgi:hypothetical protein